VNIGNLHLLGLGKRNDGERVADVVRESLVKRTVIELDAPVGT
jgi:hypothetical protein